MRAKVVLTIVAVAMAVAAVPVVAHHAFSAEFDADAPIHLEGVVVRMEWINPHAWIHLEITNEDGSKEVWMVEGGTPNTLLRRGFNRQSLLPGSNKGNGRDLTFRDGRKLFMGSSGTGAPSDGRDPTDPPE